MNLGGWIVMLLSVGGTTALLAWCVMRVVQHPSTAEHMHSPADIDPGDSEK